MVSPLTKKFERRSESIQREVRHIRRDSSLTKEEGSVFLAVVAAVTHSVSISVCPQHQQRVYEGLQTEFHHHDSNSHFHFLHSGWGKEHQGFYPPGFEHIFLNT